MSSEGELRRPEHARVVASGANPVLQLVTSVGPEERACLVDVESVLAHRLLVDPLHRCAALRAVLPGCRREPAGQVAGRHRTELSERASASSAFLTCPATRKIALAHVMAADEDFDTTADKLFQLVKHAAATNPGAERHLHLDIEGHRNPAGGWDTDALEIQKEFVVDFLGRWLTGVNVPLYSATTAGQHEDIPDSMMTVTPGA